MANITSQEFLDRFEKQLRGVGGIIVVESEASAFYGAVGNMVRAKEVSIPDPRPADPETKVYITIQESDKNSFHNGNNPKASARSDNKVWMNKVAEQEFDDDTRRKTLAGVTPEQAVFSFKLTLSAQTEMLQYFIDNTGIAGRITDSLRLETADTSGVDAFRDFLNGSSDWTEPPVRP